MFACILLLKLSKEDSNSVSHGNLEEKNHKDHYDSNKRPFPQLIYLHTTIEQVFLSKSVCFYVYHTVNAPSLIKSFVFQSLKKKILINQKSEKIRKT